MSDKKSPLSVEDQLKAAQEALRLQELDAAEREERIATLEAQQAKAATEETAVTNLPVITHKKKKYRFKYHALIVAGKKMTADEIAEDDKLVEEIIASGSSAIEEA